MTHAGKPDLDELRRASQLALDESQITHSNALHGSNMRNQMKIKQLTGEDWQKIARPRSKSPGNGRNTRGSSSDRNAASKLQSFFGARPPSEMIIHEIKSYFPSHHQKDIEKTMRMSVRRSQRLSRAASRLSVVSNASLASSLRDASLRDAPPIPSIADTWLQSAGQATTTATPQPNTPQPNTQTNRNSRPISASRFNLPQESYRDSVASSSLQPLQEESPIEPNRKSYVSFDSASEDNAGSRQSLIDENASVAATDGGSVDGRL
ncbi:ATP binding, partial [Elasticomyces elasticus]